MKKRLVSISLIVTLVQFSGCGGSSGGSSNPPDEVAPSFTNDRYMFDVNEGDVKTVSLITDDAEAIFKGNGVLGSTLTFSATEVDEDTRANITVTATDIAGNSSSKVFTFNVKDIPVSVLGYVAEVGNKTFATLGNNELKGPSGLVWKDENPVSTVSYEDAQVQCKDGFRLPTAVEVLNIVDYVTPKGENSSMLDSDFANNIVNDANGSAVVSGVWVNTTGIGGMHHYVHLVGGVDVLETENKEHTVICVKGEGQNNSSNFTVNANEITDTKTGYIWTKINIVENTSTYQAVSCPSGFSMPNINELRTIYNFSNNTLASEIAAAGVLSIWSSTINSKDSQQYYVLRTDNNASVGVGFDDGSDSRHFTCVKKP